MTTVLVVDDQADIRLLVCTVLRAHGFDTVEAADGTEALAILRAEDPPDVVLLDIWMPPPDGMEVLDAIHAEQLGVKTVMVSAHADRSSEEEAMRRHADAFVVKPFVPDELVRTLRRVVEPEPA